MKTTNRKRLLSKLLIYFSLYLFTFAIVYSTFILNPNDNNSYPFLRAVIVFFASVLLIKYFIYMLLSPWHDVITAYRALSVRRKMREYSPLVSIMIPAWNESMGVIDTLKTVLESSYRNIEIVLVNDGSTDDSDKLIKQFIRKYDHDQMWSMAKERYTIAIKYIYKQNGGKGAALNTAIANASGDILMSIDADCVIMPDTVANFVKCFADPKVMAAVGNVKVGNTRTTIGVIQYLEFLFSFYFKKADSLMNTIYIIGGAAGAFRKEVFQKLGGYNTKNITEDIELSVRIQDNGMKIVYADDAIVYTEGASRLRDLMKQRLRWKRGRFETFIDHKHMFFSTSSRHNKILSWIILPLAYFGELQLSLELFFLSFLYVYSYLVSDYSSFISGIIMVGSMFFIQIFFDEDRGNKARLILLAPIGWLLLCLCTFVEFNALLKSVWGLVRKKELKWQKWQREGVHS